MKAKLIITSLACASVLALFSGCSSIQRGTPVAAPVINANLDKNDIEIGPSTEGKSTKSSILLGLIQIIDGNKYRILGIKFFEDEYALQERPWYSFLSGVDVRDRAYYHALAATPDADTIVPKAFVATESGFPILYHNTEVTFQGKTLKYKPHN